MAFVRRALHGRRSIGGVGRGRPWVPGLMGVCVPSSGLPRMLSGAAPKPKEEPPYVHRDLTDADRIFTNLYGEHDIGVNGAIKRVHTSGITPVLVCH